MTDLTTLPVDADSAQLILITADDALTAQLNQDVQQKLDLRNNLDNFYLRVSTEDQNVQVVNVPVYKQGRDARAQGLSTHDLFMDHNGQLRVLKSNRTWFNLDTSNKYSVAGRLF